MIILDTNVLSAVIAPVPVKAVTDWLDRQTEADLYVSAITIYEMRFGIECLPDSRKRRVLELAFEDAVLNIVGGRVLPFDWHAATEAGKLAAKRSASGRPADSHDTQIAAIALSHRAAVATRNIRHFSDIGLPIINPWLA